MEIVLSVLVGLGLAAACGFRVFVPLLVLGVASKAGAVDLGNGMAWVGSTEAIVALAVAAAVEIGAYWVPWLDHALDTLASPAAVIAGTLVAGSQFGDTGPFLGWSAALIAGGGLAGTVQATSVATRLVSTATTAGVANPVVSTLQSVMSAALAVLAVVAPILAAIVLVAVLIVGVRVLLVLRRRRMVQAA